ncbi:hypothetical protein BJV82DRAFT_361163 [Fennellomyces sp. T-0311]|nr:hypothetical protein BJV82DRAFT_361163 [Fennellomyces sp. T-0311]
MEMDGVDVAVECAGLGKFHATPIHRAREYLWLRRFGRCLSLGRLCFFGDRIRERREQIDAGRFMSG